MLPVERLLFTVNPMSGRFPLFTSVLHESDPGRTFIHMWRELHSRIDVLLPIPYTTEAANERIYPYSRIPGQVRCRIFPWARMIPSLLLPLV